MDEFQYSDDKATLGDRISAAREAAGMSVEELARKIGVRRPTLSGWEDDQREPRANQLSILAGLTGVSLLWLMTGHGVGSRPGNSDSGDGSAERDVALTELRALRQTIGDATRRLDRLEQLISA